MSANLLGRSNLRAGSASSFNSIRVARDDSTKLPRAYEDGFCDFYGRKFEVSPAVLIPRPETEQMVDMILALAGKPYLPGVKPEPAAISENPVILDVGTGSGCVAATLALELPDAEVLAVDISPDALAVAKRNARTLGARVKFLQSDLLNGLFSESAGGSSENSLSAGVNFSDASRPDRNCAVELPEIIVANLPYVDPEWDWLDKEALSFEPSLALYAENGGLALIFRLIDEVQSAYQNSESLRGSSLGATSVKEASACENSEKRWLILEADPCQHAKIVAYAEKRGFAHEKTRGFILVFSY